MAELMNMTFIKKVCCVLINRSPSIAINKQTTKEVWSDTSPSYFDLKNLYVLLTLMFIMKIWDLVLESAYFLAISLVLIYESYDVEKQVKS